MKKYNGMYITEALETAKQRLTLLAARQMRHTTEAETKRINSMFSKEPSKLYSLLYSNIPRQYWEINTETEASHQCQNG